MSNILAEIQVISVRFKELVILVDSHMSPKKRRSRKTTWKEIKSSIEELAKSFQHVVKEVGISPINQEANALIASSGPLLPAPDHTPTESHHSPQNSPRPLEEAQDNEINIQEISPLKTLGPDADTMVAPPSQPEEPLQSIPRNPTITVPYRKEDGVIVLMPDKDQCRDIPYLISQARELGAHDTGAFKYVLPDELVADLPPILSVPKDISKFKSSRHKENSYHISRTIEHETLNFDDIDFTPTPLDKFAETLEGRLTDPQAMRKMQYCTDAEARNPQDRQKFGLPEESPIWPLKDNQLDRTRFIIPGLHYPFAYISGPHGSVFSSHEEDGKIPSLNALHDGEKLWYVVARKDGHLIENIVKRGKCAQKIRHASLWFTRSDLKALGASFVNFVQHANEVVVVFEGIYHHGGTIGKSRAEAINYAPPGWSIKGYSACSSNCPGFPIPNAYLEFRDPDDPQREQCDKGSSEEVQSTPSGRRSKADVIDTLNGARSSQRKRKSSTISSQQNKKIRTSSRQVSDRGSKDSLNSARSCQRKEQPPPLSPLLSQMKDALSSRDAILQFFEIVRGRRLEPTILRLGSEENAVEILHSISGKKAFHDLVTRLYQTHVADQNEEHLQGYAEPRKRAKRGSVQNIVKVRRMTERQYYEHKRRGAKWREYREKFPGILAFILFNPRAFGFTSSAWLELELEDFNSLQHYLDKEHMSALRVAGSKFEASLCLTADDVEFIGESKSLEKATLKQLISYLQPVPITNKNVYSENKYPNWRRPKSWPEGWKWPCNPMSIPPGEVQCELCKKNSCDCASLLRPDIPPRIWISESKGRGVLAVGKEEGDIVYPANTCVGELVGKLAPPNTYHNGMCFAVFRADLPDEPEVAQINCSEIRNILGLMNHDCNPNVKPFGRRVSGEYRIMLYTIRDVKHGEELTYNYGLKFWEPDGCPCSVCRVRRVGSSPYIDCPL
ncbi:hypothetical protein RBB50_012672 [Rhinocladiella similis]